MSDSFVAEIEDLICRRLWSLDRHERRRLEDAALDIYSQTDSIIALRHGRPVAPVHEPMGRAFNLGSAHHIMEATTVPMQRIPYFDDLLENRGDAPPRHRGSGHGLYDVRYAAPPDSRPHHSSRHAGGSHSYASRRNSHRESGSSRHTGGAAFGWTRHRHRSDTGRSRHDRAWSNERFRRDAEEAARRSAEEDARERRDRDRHRYDRYGGRHAGRYDDRDDDRHGDYFTGSRSGTSGRYSPPPRHGHGYSSSSHRAHPPPRPHPQPYPQAPPANETPTQRFVRLTKTPYGFYDILGVDREASQAEIRKAYRKTAFLHHPDRNPGDEENTDARFKAINEAQETLTDDLQKERYDIFGMKPLS